MSGSSLLHHVLLFSFPPYTWLGRQTLERQSEESKLRCDSHTKSPGCSLLTNVQDHICPSGHSKVLTELGEGQLLA